MTYYEVIERFDSFAYVRCKPQTGRTHQIRVHLTHIGHPILADKAYSGRGRITIGDLRNPGHVPADETAIASDEVLIERQALHAHMLAFRHPVTEREIELTAPIPEDMARTLEALRKYRSVHSSPPSPSNRKTHSRGGNW